jgi:hypothetical protein
MKNKDSSDAFPSLSYVELGSIRECGIGLQSIYTHMIGWSSVFSKSNRSIYKEAIGRNKTDPSLHFLSTLACMSCLSSPSCATGGTLRPCCCQSDDESIGLHIADNLCKTKSTINTYIFPWMQCCVHSPRNWTWCWIWVCCSLNGIWLCYVCSMMFRVIQRQQAKHSNTGSPIVHGSSEFTWEFTFKWCWV